MWGGSRLRQVWQVPSQQPEPLELPDELEEGQATAPSFGRRRSRVRKACAIETRVTWWFQPR